MYNIVEIDMKSYLFEGKVVPVQVTIVQLQVLIDVEPLESGF